ncbi:MAG: TolB family protein, partial [Planctomycetota bacterium]
MKNTVRYILFSALVILLSASQIPAKVATGQSSALGAEKQIALRAAIEDLITTFGPRYPRGKEYLAQLDRIEQRLKKAQKPDLSDIKADFDNLQHQALIDNPLVSGRPILFVMRRQYKSDHHNTATMFQTGEINTKSFQGGGALKTIDFAEGGKITTLIESSEGLIRDPEVHFNGEKIIFSMRNNIRDDYHIYEINADGTGLKQLTSAPGVADFDPLYMPDDTIVFSSTREPKYCMCNRHIMGNLFRMDTDGANIHQIGKSTLHEGHAALMPDGRIIYDRWEYVDRNFGDAQGLWTVNPDGTNHCVYWGNNTWSPGGVIDARPIPGTQNVLSVFGSCHDRPWGALAIIDRRLGVDGRASVVRTWPASAINLVKEKGSTPGVYGFDNFQKVKPKYEDPYPLNDKYFLCSRMTGRGELMGIYLIDVFGNEILLHPEQPGCYDPMPLGPQPRPLIIPSRRNFRDEPGYLYVIDVYQGTHMQGVKRGTIKYL